MMSRRRAPTQRSASPGPGRMMRTRSSMKTMDRLDSGGGVILYVLILAAILVDC
jgi:hypothetical protein